MRPVLFTFRGRPIHSYLVLLYLGLTAGVYAGVPAARDSGIAPDRYAAVTLILIAAALAGAHLLYVLTHRERYRGRPRAVWSNRNGAAMYGGLIAAVAISPAALVPFAIPAGAYWDAAAVTMLVGMAFGRVGCLLTGCCCGRPSESWFAIRLPNLRGEWRRRVPMQPIESMLAAALAVAAMRARPYAPFRGAIFLAVLTIYGGCRAILQGYREEFNAGRDRRAARWISIVLATAALLAIVALWPRALR